ncbi:hypothetical protein BXP70_21545 [Hymenobacter crusticola]|uniref:TonB C-terminal domain-containing protein n=2 Tax=Hymenobacter crusticola TaxID=1770526 RepID=A0A243WAX5_9BACT|nr:hypothetical protein BXP70_21545 [Hymenobacter crusticola]
MLLSTLVLGALWVLYYLALRSERCFRYNRFFLLLAPALAAGLPLLQLPSLWPAAPTLTNRLPSFLLPEVGVGIAASIQPNTNWLLWVYGAGVAVFLAHLAWQLWQQWRFTQALPIELQSGYTLRLTGGRQPTGSFGRTVYWDETTLLDAFEAEQILAHELAHVRQGHTYDRLWLALWRAALWFNPFVHLLPRALHLTHEYLADAAASQATPISYTSLLARQAAAHLGFTPALTTTFHTSSILTRIAMLHHPPVLRRWKQWLALPVGALLLTIVACEKTSYTGALPEPRPSGASATTSVATAPPVPLAKKDTIFTYVEHMPEYPGGISKLLADIGANTHYPPVAVEAGVEGKVFVGFIVEKDGSLSGVRLQHGLQEEGTQAAAAKAINEEALRVISTLPGQWTPGKQGNRLVKVSYVVPILFAKQ